MPSKKKVSNVTKQSTGSGVSSETKKTSSKSSKGKSAKSKTSAAAKSNTSKKGGVKTTKAKGTKKATPSTKTKTSTVAVKRGGAQTKKSPSRTKHSKISQDKGRNKPEMQKLTLVHAADDTSFWINQGPILKNLVDLSNALADISDEQYQHHARDIHDNDFARWVNDVLCDGECASELQNASDRQKAKDVVATRLHVYSF